MQLVSSQNQKAVGSRIKQLRFSKGMTQTALADTLGVTPSYVSAIERGKKSVTRKMVEKLVALFEVNEASILVDINDKKSTENVPLIVQKMSHQSENGGQSEAVREQRLKALWNRVINDGRIDMVGLHTVEFGSVMGAYSDAVLAFISKKANEQIMQVLGQVLDGVLPIEEAPARIKAILKPLEALEDKFNAIQHAISDAMEDALKHYPEALELIKGAPFYVANLFTGK